MRNRDPYDGPPFDGYPGDRYPPADLTDEAQFYGLGPREGDEAPKGRAGYPWGKTFQLTQGQSVTAIATERAARPYPIAIQLRFATTADGPFTQTIPVTYSGTVNVAIIKSFDLKSGTATESFSIAAAQAQPFCVVLARSISVVVSVAPTSEIPPIFVQAVAAPVHMIDCDMLEGPSYGGAVVTRVATVATATDLLDANVFRKQFSIFNNSTQPLAIKFGPNPSLGAGSESYTRIIAAGGVYESPIGGYGGLVTGIWAGTDASGEALITEGA